MSTAIIMPLSGWMFSVSLPTIRDSFGVEPDLAAWISTAFSLPFMISMPIYGRVSDGLGKRRLLLIGTAIFIIGSLLVTASTSLATLLIGRAVQGFGIAGLLPLSLALLAEVFPKDKRGNAMGTYSTIGPLTGAVAPILAGFIVANWGWRASFVPPIAFAVIGLVVIYWLIPSATPHIRYDFLRAFDWTGVGLLSATLISLLFFLSSRPITGVPALQDWRLFAATCFFLALFVWYENRRDDPFINLTILRNRTLVIGSLCAALRMVGLSGGMGFLMPLYMADVFQLTPNESGLLLMANPAAMAVFVRFAGRLSDRWGSRILVMSGFTIFGGVMFTLSQLSTDAPRWTLGLILITFGIGAGLMLASLHRAALNDVPETEVGTSSGIYSMIRFLGSTCGAAVGGILLQNYLAQSHLTVLSAYQNVFLWFFGFAMIGLVIALRLPNQN